MTRELIVSTRAETNGWTTGRSYRSLSEAFSDVRAPAVEHHHVPRIDRWLGVVLAILMGIAGGVCLVRWAAGA